MALKKDELADSVLDATDRLYRRGLNATLSGNVSARIDSKTMLITPSGIDKGRMSKGELSIVEISSGRLLAGSKQSSEYQMHTHIYGAVAEVRAIAHPHPQYSLAMVDAMGRKNFLDAISGNEQEYSYYIGIAKSLPRVPSGTVRLAEEVARAVKSGAKVVIMEGHGTVGVGKTMHEALSRVEYLEHLAKKQFIAEMLKGRTKR
jgi:L-fuculose-phosphate aldolase